MLKKAMSLGLCVTSALLLGCNHSKPPSSKLDTEVTMEEGSNAPPDALPSKTAVAPVASSPRNVAPTQQGGVQFGPLPQNVGKDPWADAEREKIRNARRMQAAGIKPSEKQLETQDAQATNKDSQ